MAEPFDAKRLALAGEAVPVAEQVQVDVQTQAGAFSVSETGLLAYQTGSGASRLTWFDRTGRQLGALGDPGTYDQVFLSPDGTRVSVSIVEPGATTPDK